MTYNQIAANIITEIRALKKENETLRQSAVILARQVEELSGYKEAWVVAQRARSTAERELATLKQSQGEPVAQFRKHGCSDWYDGYPDNDDCGGPYETRTLYTSTPTIPEGWQLVPIKPTPEMREAWKHNKDFALNAWEAMLFAAPKPENE